MKKLFLTFLLLASAATALNAQTIVKGDMNDDGKVDVSDVTMTVSTILGNTPLQTISVGDSYAVDNTAVLGKWYLPSGRFFNFNSDGTTTYPGGATYEFMPGQGRLVVYTAAGRPLKVFPIFKADDQSLLAVDYATGNFIYFTREKPQVNSGSSNDHAYVDLGLPSGTMWATCNVGATSPEGYGYYFAWGETVVTDSIESTWSYYQWCNGSENTISKYTDIGISLELETDDDAAYGDDNWGTEWRIPSHEQCEELLSSSNTTTKRTKRKGVEGLLITSLSNGQSIFLPAAGFYMDGRSHEMGEGGYYWSRTRYQWSPSIAYFMTFQKPDVVTAEDLLNRCCGMTIRPVCTPGVNQ